MDNRNLYFTLIGKRLAYLKTEVTLFNSLNLTDINIYAENFYRDFFNRLGYEFNNTNFIENNFAHIDLIDTKNKVAIQVTSQNDNKKIKEAIDGFYNNQNYKDYQLKLVLISKDAKDYRTKFGNNFNHKEDVLDIKKILAIINNIDDLDKLKDIADFLDKQILQERKKTESNEVETIMALIEYLSKDNNLNISQKPENADPQFKILNRFSDHSTTLINLYTDIYTVYQQPLIEAKKGIDGVKAIKISSYLKDESDKILTLENNNPRTALEKLVEIFHSKLSENGIKFDKIAIKFYLLDELINCNVFPNN
ncbi:SMEK domain-containing protein [Elizabethkingia anophelis]|uniref:SMEK domain-containing protein n=1 Tax=Elizabethkingia anophelis TaxID=1117645 RepID=UPI0011EB3C85|nr:SMEK domain-containing protein [Elizabethkingia anophelis]TYT28261.1 SMEK domain-containing protein [Elizabethkingia anophelis]UKY88770.1 SMEK domain-containing protein [Elizabethkingia anophelis]UKY95940.1 SMEK domain-containing protein [Elizabethkingia anophelis]